MATNLIRCKYCNWERPRFSGPRHNEDLLRTHVLETHEEAYLAARGLADCDDDSPWDADSYDLGERPL